MNKFGCPVRAGIHNRSSGFALIETLISFVVLAVGLLALMSFHSESQRNISEAKAQAEALAVAEQKLQELESFLSSADTRLDDGTATDTVTGVLNNFARSWTVATDAADASQKTATVTVTWNDRDGAQQSVVLSSNFFFRDPTADMSNFIALVDATNSAAQGGGGSWDTDGGLTTGDGDSDQGDGDGDGNGSDDGGDDTSGEDDSNPTNLIIEISGSIETNNGGSFGGVSGTNGTVCVQLSGSYTCTVLFSSGGSWSGTLTYTASNRQICTPNGGVRSFSNITSDQTQDVCIAKADQCESKC